MTRCIILPVYWWYVYISIIYWCFDGCFVVDYLLVIIDHVLIMYWQYTQSSVCFCLKGTALVLVQPAALASVSVTVLRIDHYWSCGENVLAIYWFSLSVTVEDYVMVFIDQVLIMYWAPVSVTVEDSVLVIIDHVLIMYWSPTLVTVEDYV